MVKELAKTSSFLMVFFVLSLMLFLPSTGFSQQELVTVKSVGFEETIILEISNEKNNPGEIDTVRTWLPPEINFKSFKTEKGWTGKKTPEGLIVFSGQDTIKPGESVKFGIKTDVPTSGINWKALDKNGNELGIGKSQITQNIVSEKPTPSPTNNQNTTPSKEIAIKENSIFKLIPEKPKVGSHMRVVGDNFGANQPLDFYIGNQRIDSFTSDEKGDFIFTSQIPKDQKAERIDFKIKDKQGNEKIVSLRIGESQDRMTAVEQIPLKVGLPSIIHRGEILRISGTATPGSTVTATIINLQTNETTTTEPIEVDSNGKWVNETIVPLDAAYGKYNAEITDGIDSIEKSFTIESGQIIELAPIKIKYEPGEKITFNGTAIRNQELEITLEDPQGAEVFSDIIEVGPSGKVFVEIPTENASPQGTYVLFASQGDENEIFLVGLGELPQVQLLATMNKLNYKPSEEAIIEIQGPALSTVSLLVIDPADKNKFSESVSLGPDGKHSFPLSLKGYGSGVYTVVITRGNAQSSDIFSVGLQTGSGPVEMTTTKSSYLQGETILILGNSGENIIITLTLSDPDGKEIKRKETFTNKDGIFSDNSFRIPLDGKEGVWLLQAKSGPNFAKLNIDVLGKIDEGLVVRVDRVPEQYTWGDLVTINGVGARPSQSLFIDIFGPESDEPVEELTIFTKENGGFTTIWKIPEDLIPGDYTIKIEDAVNTAETNFEIVQ